MKVDLSTNQVDRVGLSQENIKKIILQIIQENIIEIIQENMAKNIHEINLEIK